ncbi:hypothetical protein [Arthrobacter mangrovi]|uniref:Uncharacterized protein n=1 Tax=Arthrobacter mangrovi TaxID=2966350 RepID=A0ABQ5MPZ7_9MICC|nr:hypothetical protein [Arthrobacter mangrovi]GLB66065.1 hypothetical protein AHIS1636_05040 [Arthrobacter mangrovi]
MANTSAEPPQDAERPEPPGGSGDRRTCPESSPDAAAATPNPPGPATPNPPVPATPRGDPAADQPAPGCAAEGAGPGPFDAPSDCGASDTSAPEGSAGPAGVPGVGPRPADPLSCRPPWEEHSWEEGEAVDAEGIPLDAPDTPIPLYVLTGHYAPPEEDPWAAGRGAFTPPAWEPVLPARSGQVGDLLPLLGSREPSRMLYQEAAHELIAARRASA